MWNNELVIMEIGEKVMISPDLTNKAEWTEGKVIEVEDNSFVGTVISAETPDGNVFFGYRDLFKTVSEVCTL